MTAPGQASRPAGAGLPRLRLMFSCLPVYGHFNSLAPVARAVRRAGHEVAFATAAAFREPVVTAGFTHLPAGLSPDEMDALGPDERGVLAAERWPVGMRVLGGAVGAVNRRALSAAIAAWRPDAVVNDAMDLAGAAAAADAGIPHLTHGIGAVPPAGVLAAADEAARRELWVPAGRTPVTPGGLFDHLFINIWPPGLQPGTPWPMLHVRTQAGAEHHPDPAARAARRRPRVYLTVGTIFPAGDVLRRIAAAIATLDVDLVVTVGPGRSRQVLEGVTARGDLAVETYLPQEHILPHCDLVVCHGGAGTIIGALAHGLPMVLFPLGADHFYNARLCVEAGVGTALSPQLTPARQIRSAVEQVLGAPDGYQRAAEVRAQIRAMPGPDECAARLLAHLRHGQPLRT